MSSRNSAVAERMWPLSRMITRNQIGGNWLKMLGIWTIGTGLLIALVVVVRSTAGRSATAAAVGTSKQHGSSLRHSSTPTLHIGAIIKHGHIIEIRGSTDPGAIVMINGQTAATIFDGNGFRHFLGPLPAGVSIISVTSQDQQGGVNTQQVAVTIE